MGTLSRVGYGQVEPNHLSAQRTGQIYAQLPADNTAFGNADAKLENGQFVKYDYEAGKVNLTGKGEWMLVFNEVKLYDERKQMYRDFALKATDFMDSVMTPRVFKTNVGDIYTTNMVESTCDCAVGNELGIDADTGLLKEVTTETADNFDTMRWLVVKETTMPDGQAAVKLMRIK